MIRIRKNDTVYVIAGRDRGKTGKVMKIFPRASRVLVEGVNRIKKHRRRTREDQKGGIVELESPLHISNVQIYCKSCSKPVHIGVKFEKDNNKVRICKRCKEVI